MRRTTAGVLLPVAAAERQDLRPRVEWAAHARDGAQQRGVDLPVAHDLVGDPKMHGMPEDEGGGAFALAQRYERVEFALEVDR